ncbi:MAG: dihydroorotase [Desulfobulbaceae bacterium]|uniref:Dihydroorotase n=1 Tax=Candidatus Desulfobia pelagia TaxID=2841692 RepID=A0A8J6NFD6_9BACT|nr:dihydroorotase [Candidatus Desulfobia pelagia]
MKGSSVILFQNCRIIDPANNIDTAGDMILSEGRITAVGKAGSLKLQSSEGIIFDLDGKWLVPGLIDMHVHLREPGEEYKETVASGTRSAAAGGFTAVACMPNTSPVNDSEAITALILRKAEQAKMSRVYPVGAVSKNSRGTELAEYGEMKQAGVVALSDDGRPVANSQLMRRALEYSSSHDLLLISHSEEMSLSENGAINEGALSTRLGLRGIPHVAEEIMVYRDIALADYLRLPIHIAHISTKETVDLIRRAKRNGSKVTTETTPHYFSLTEEAVGRYDTRAKMNPPLRTSEDVEAIREGLRDGTIDAIATDHAPHSNMEKDLEFELAANGIIGLETSVPLAIALVRDNLLTATQMIELMSVRPARILRVPGGSLSEGSIADVTVIDPDRKFIYTRDSIVSKSTNSPFIDWELQGKAVLTVVGGEIVFNELG